MDPGMTLPFLRWFSASLSEDHGVDVRGMGSTNARRAFASIKGHNAKGGVGAVSPPKRQAVARFILTRWPTCGGTLVSVIWSDFSLGKFANSNGRVVRLGQLKTVRLSKLDSFANSTGRVVRLEQSLTSRLFKLDKSASSTGRLDRDGQLQIVRALKLGSLPSDEGKAVRLGQLKIQSSSKLVNLSMVSDNIIFSPPIQRYFKLGKTPIESGHDRILSQLEIVSLSKLFKPDNSSGNDRKFLQDSILISFKFKSFPSDEGNDNIS
mmetsp:Transcript_14774/g.26514  ORF Transcript_14774/g.26514 Transcript_14774/m.26514 type:complete len:265 (-) Transcript_14774:854-1648(-)